MPILISDANILIDMECGGLLQRMFRLQDEFAVLDVLYEEELKDQHPDLPGLGLQIIELRPEWVAHGEALTQANSRSGASRNDLLSLALAQQERSTLLTGDRRLRQICEGLDHPVKGTLWLLEAMHKAGIINADEADRAYRLMREQGRRLPWNEISAQLRRMRG